MFWVWITSQTIQTLVRTLDFRPVTDLMLLFLSWVDVQNCVFESYLTSAQSFHIINLLWEAIGSGVSYVTMRERFININVISYLDILMYQHSFFPDQTS